MVVVDLGTSTADTSEAWNALTRRWGGALLGHESSITFEILEAHKRPVSAVADFTEVRDVVSVSVFEDRTTSLALLFDPEHNLEERITNEQFSF